MAGLTASAKQFVEKIKAATAQGALDRRRGLDGAAGPGRGEGGRTPNPYEGMLGTTGQITSERWANKSPLLQQCVDIYEKATGTTVPGPDEADG